jgi:hypothetical protein
VIVAGTLLLAGPAIGKKHAPKKHYTSSGHGTFESTGQACFGAEWAGTGGWKTSYERTTIETNVGTTTDTFDGDSSYSWDERAVAGGAERALELLKFPGSKPSGGATWNKGYVRIGSSGRGEALRRWRAEAKRVGIRARRQRSGQSGDNETTAHE